MTPQALAARWAFLQANAHQPEVQEQIRHEIRKGTIRVRPAADGGIVIQPVSPQGDDPASTRASSSRMSMAEY